MLSRRKILKSFAVAAVVCAATAFGLFVTLLSDARPITFESLESKTSALEPVFNSVTFRRETLRDGTKRTADVWMMAQSHNGPDSPDWDRLAIQVTSGPDGRKASYWQLRAGSLDQFESHESLPYKVKCMMCHSSGPRVIRPNYDSRSYPVSTWDQLRIALWNLRIKTYGPVSTEYPQGAGIFDRKAAEDAGLAFANPALNAALEIGACSGCHDDDGWIRSGLRRENFLAIQYMVEHGLMPPKGFHLSRSDRETLAKFIGLPSLQMSESAE